MGKKQRRNQSRKIPAGAVRPAGAISITAQAQADEPRRMRVTAKAAPGATWEEFGERYRYVNAELKQIGILAGAFLIVLLILNAVIG